MRYIYYIIVFLLFSSCDSNCVFEKDAEITDAIWDIEEKPSFEVEINDTLTPHNFYLNIRHAGTYPFSNIYVFIYTTFPNGKIAKDTVECKLADNKGKWLGDGIGDIWDNQFLFKAGKKFPITGKYIFELEHGMRTERLPFIMDVGIRIEKVKEI